MGIATTLQEYLDGYGVVYDVLTHKRTDCSSNTAQASHVSTDCLAKGVVLKREDEYILAVVPASTQVELDELQRWLKQPVQLASEDEIDTLFSDCDTGAVPPIGAAYGIKVIVDESLEDLEEIYFEGGDHRTLVHLSGEQFHHLMEKVPHHHFSAELPRSYRSIVAS